MRITGGALGGRVLLAPADSRIRPTTDKVRQAIFNILAHNDFRMRFSLEGARVADLFAGTGALGLEALSHGARFCLFVDDSLESRALLRRNIEALQLSGASKVWRRDATRLGPMPVGSGGPFDLVFLDPPYRKDILPPALASLAEGKWLARTSLLVAETGVEEEVSCPSVLQKLESRVYGDTRISFLASGSDLSD